MKYVVFLIDGLADEPVDEIGGITPSEAARTPNLDRLAHDAVMGTLITLPEGFPTSSDVANLSVLGYDLGTSYTGRGPIEAASAGIDLGENDIAFRLNIISVKNDILTDYSAGQIQRETAREIIRVLQEELGSESVQFYPGVSYRNLLVLRGKEYSADIEYHKPDSSHGMNIRDIYPKARSESAKHTEKVIMEIMEQSFDICSRFHKKGSHGDMVWPWSPGKKPVLKSFMEKYNKTGAIISAVDVIKGIGLLAGMDVVNVDGATGYLDTNFEGKAEAAFASLDDHDFIYCHIECVDEVSHEGSLEKKIKAIELFDKRLLGTFLKLADKANIMKEIVIGVIPDHPVPIKKRMHTRDAVPFMIYSRAGSDGFERYNEKNAARGSAGLLKGDAFMKKLFASS
ncbi:cofactor-independent phosphoglycerate mutase [Spirochaetota bacterium]